MQLGKYPNKIGKIYSATYFLKRNLPEWEIAVTDYDKTLNLCEKMYRISFDPNYRLPKELNDCVSIHGLGLRLLYKVRNSLMHGDFFFPEPMEYSSTLPFHAEIINLCSRLILLSTQMLFLSFRNGGYDENLEFFNSSIIEENENCNLVINEKIYLSKFHIRRPKVQDERLELDLK